jgi:TPR repeat protein/serine/threonine protein kinase
MPILLLRCLARAVARHGVKFVCSLVPGGEVLSDIAASAWEDYRQDQHEGELRAEIEALARAPAEEVRQEVQSAVRDEAADLPAEVREKIANYLGQVPAMIRRSMRRPSDPAGMTVRAGLRLEHREDLAQFLPAGPPRFRAGDRPLPGVDWVLEEPLGQGGFGEVWKARHAHLRSRPPVALKFCLDPSAVAALRNEVGVLDHVMQNGRHSGVVPLLQTYLNADPPCLEYQYIEGGDLAGLIRELHDRKRLTPALANRLILRLAEVIASTHRADPPIVHEDLKPANVLVRRGEEGRIALYVTDYGIGGLAGAGAIREAQQSGKSREQLVTDAVRGAYTPLYASPEQMARRRGEPADPRDDVHALGVIWYQMLTGDLGMLRLPADWREEVQARGQTTQMCGLLARCLASKAERRPANAAVFADQLRDLMKGPVKSAAPAGKPRSTPPAGRPGGPPSEGRNLRLMAEEDWRECDRVLMRTGSEKPYLMQTAPTRLTVWRAAAEAGLERGQCLLGLCLAYGIGVKKDLVEALLWFNKAADRGFAGGELNLGWVYRDGLGVSKDYSRAMGWYRRAADQEHAAARNHIGWLYQHGRGVPKDFAAALRWYQMAAGQGNAPAQNNLGWMYLEGLGVPKDYAEAGRRIRQAADQGYAAAQNNLGWLYENGHGVPRDYSEALRWYRRAAERGIAGAQYNLGSLYLAGLGVPADYAEARRWFQRAADQGNVQAKALIEKMAHEHT